MPLEFASQTGTRKKGIDSTKQLLPGIPVAPEPPLGISLLQEQRVRRIKRLPYVFNMMVVGDSGLGKTTFINSFFKSELKEAHQLAPETVKQTFSISPQTFELLEEGITLTLTIVDTPGFGQSQSKQESLNMILDYINVQFEAFSNSEKSSATRKVSKDTRIHCVIYFISPSNYKGLKPFDIVALKQLTLKANVIPVIAKADSFTEEELASIKLSIKRDLAINEIRIYPTYHTDDHWPELEECIPFAVISSSRMSRKSRARQYRWGTVDIEEFGELMHLRTLIIQNNLQDLIESCHQVHYMEFRVQKYNARSRQSTIPLPPEEEERQLEQLRKNLASELKRREEEMRQRFVVQVREKEKMFKAKEEELKSKRMAMLEELSNLQKALNQEQELYRAAVAASEQQRPSNLY